VYGREGRRACLPLSRRRIREGARLPKVAAAGERAGLEARTQHIGLSQKAARGGDRGSVNKEISHGGRRFDWMAMAPYVRAILPHLGPGFPTTLPPFFGAQL
jgi:hypothetical protein